MRVLSSLYTDVVVLRVSSNQLTRLDHPEGVLGYFNGGYFASQGDIYTTWQDSANPSNLIALDGKTGELKSTLLSAGKVPAGRGFKSITYQTENGESIQGWLSTPASSPPYPTILHIHGGPTAVQTNTFSPLLQSWLDHDFAVLIINYHGSTTFGKEFEKSIWENLGDLEVQDLAAAARWLIDNGISIDDKILLTGGSYGGYLTLLALGKRPELWVGGMAQVAIADWRLMGEDQAEALRGYQRALFGGSPDDVPEVIERSSPITYAEQVAAPLLIIQGVSDTRCPARQMRLYEQRMQSLGKQLEIVWFDAGHGSRAQEEQIEHQEQMLRFAYRLFAT